MWCLKLANIHSCMLMPAVLLVMYIVQSFYIKSTMINKLIKCWEFVCYPHILMSITEKRDGERMALVNNIIVFYIWSLSDVHPCLNVSIYVHPWSTIAVVNQKVSTVSILFTFDYNLNVHVNTCICNMVAINRII